MATTTACSGCSKQLAESDVLFNPAGDPVCQTCNDKQDLAKTLQATAGRSAATREYEFDGAENAVISGLARPMRFVGAASLVFGILFAVGGVAMMGTGRDGLLTIVEGVLMALAGSWLLPAAGALHAVADTEGNDVTNLMYALKKLTNVYWLQAVLWIIACVGVGLVLLMMLVWVV